MSVSWATVNPTYSAATSECAEPATSASSATTSCFWVRLRAIALLRIAFPPSRIRLKTGHEPHRSVDAGHARWRSGWWPFPIDRYCDDPGGSATIYEGPFVHSHLGMNGSIPELEREERWEAGG